MRKNKRIVRRLNDPPKLFFFSRGQVMAFLICFCIGGLANSVISGILLGIFMAWGLGKTGSKYHRAFWLHCLYWFVPGKMAMKWLPDSSRRSFIK